MSQPQTVLITGGGSGIGAAVARRLTGAGGRVAICGRRAASLRAAAAETGALDLVCDVGDAGAVARLLEAVTGKFGMLTQSLAVDHAHQGLRANVVCPGWTVTEMADEEMAAFGAERGLGVPEAYELVPGGRRISRLLGHEVRWVRAGLTGPAQAVRWVSDAWPSVS